VEISYKFGKKNDGCTVQGPMRTREVENGQGRSSYCRRVEELCKVATCVVQLFHSSTSSMASQLMMVMAFNKLIRVPLWLFSKRHVSMISRQILHVEIIWGTLKNSPSIRNRSLDAHIPCPQELGTFFGDFGSHKLLEAHESFVTLCQQVSILFVLARGIWADKDSRP